MAGGQDGEEAEVEAEETSPHPLSPPLLLPLCRRRISPHPTLFPTAILITNPIIREESTPPRA